MSKPAKPAAAKKDAAPVAEVAAPKSKKKLIIIVAAVALIAAGGAGWFFMKSKNSHADTPKAEVAKEPKFIPLEAFTVNLQREEADQYLQLNITLKVIEPELEEKIKAVLPEIRSKLNLLLSSKRPSELATVVGKKRLAIDIATETNTVLGIHNAPLTVAAEPVASAASGAASAHAEGAASASAEAANAAPAASHEPAVVHEPAAGHEPAADEAKAEPAGKERKGVVDVLFTSFIIQ
jgi:flagellar FliL protein